MTLVVWGQRWYCWFTATFLSYNLFCTLTEVVQAIPFLPVYSTYELIYQDPHFFIHLCMFMFLIVRLLIFSFHIDQHCLNKQFFFFCFLLKPWYFKDQCHTFVFCLEISFSFEKNNVDFIFSSYHWYFLLELPVRGSNRANSVMYICILVTRYFRTWS